VEEEEARGRGYEKIEIEGSVDRGKKTTPYRAHTTWSEGEE